MILLSKKGVTWQMEFGSLGCVRESYTWRVLMGYGEKSCSHIHTQVIVSVPVTPESLRPECLQPCESTSWGGGGGGQQRGYEGRRGAGGGASKGGWEEVDMLTISSQRNPPHVPPTGAENKASENW